MPDVRGGKHDALVHGMLYGADPVTTWPRCGHPRTPENTQSIGRGGQVRCKTCRRVTARESARRKRSLEPEVRAAIVTLTERGLAPADIAARLRLDVERVAR